MPHVPGCLARCFCLLIAAAVLCTGCADLRNVETEQPAAAPDSNDRIVETEQPSADAPDSNDPDSNDPDSNDRIILAVAAVVIGSFTPECGEQFDALLDLFTPDGLYPDGGTWVESAHAAVDQACTFKEQQSFWLLPSLEYGQACREVTGPRWKVLRRTSSAAVDVLNDPTAASFYLLMAELVRFEEEFIGDGFGEALQRAVSLSCTTLEALAFFYHVHAMSQRLEAAAALDPGYLGWLAQSR